MQHLVCCTIHGGVRIKTRYLVSTFVSSVAGMLVLSAVAPVAAADLNPVYKAPVPAIAPFNWNGFYLGANVGGAWASNAVSQSNLVKNGNRDFNVTSSGVVGGGQFGYNLVAAPNWLLGVEADVSGADLNGATTNPDSGVKFNEKIDAFGTVRGRVGYVVNNWLFYGTGGFAWSDDTFTRTQVAAGPNSPPAGDVRTNSPTRAGWAAGGGIEYGFAKNWSARVEYLHYDFGDQSFSFTASNGSFRGIDEGRLSVDSVRVGVSYLFN
jgi:outer membrane immunogenic protein